MFLFLYHNTVHINHSNLDTSCNTIHFFNDFLSSVFSCMSNGPKESRGKKKIYSPLFVLFVLSCEIHFRIKTNLQSKTKIYCTAVIVFCLCSITPAKKSKTRNSYPQMNSTSFVSGWNIKILVYFCQISVIFK